MSNLTVFQREIQAFLPEIELRFSEPMSKHTSFRIGGAAEAMAFPKTRDELAEILRQSALLDCKCAILGAGTNVLAPDAGISGLVICLKDCLDGMEQLDDTHIRDLQFEKGSIPIKTTYWGVLQDPYGSVLLFYPDQNKRLIRAFTEGEVKP